MQNFADTRSPRSVRMFHRFAGLVETRRRHARLKLDVAAKIEPLRDVIEIAQYLRLGRVSFGPLPVALKFVRERVGVLQAFDVTTRAGIAVPKPRAADAAAGLVDPRRKAQPAQAVQHVEPGETRTDDHGIDRAVAVDPARQSSSAYLGHCRDLLWPLAPGCNIADRALREPYPEEL